jgi:hypothetical protein
MSLYQNTARNAAVADTGVIARSVGLDKAKTAGLTDSLIKQVTDKLIKLSEPLHLDSHELADLNKIILHHMIEVAQGKPTAEKTDRWADAAMADLKTRHVSLKRVREVITDCNEWLRKEHPGVHQALQNSKGLGNHPKLVRLLTDRFLAHESEQARKQRSAKWVGKVRNDQANASAKIPAGGLLAGNPGDTPSGSVGATALKVIGKTPLEPANAA